MSWRAGRAGATPDGDPARHPEPEPEPGPESRPDPTTSGSDTVPDVTVGRAPLPKPIRTRRPPTRRGLPHSQGQDRLYPLPREE